MHSHSIMHERRMAIVIPCNRMRSSLGARCSGQRICIVSRRETSWPSQCLGTQCLPKSVCSAMACCRWLLRQPPAYQLMSFAFHYLAKLLKAFDVAAAGHVDHHIVQQPPIYGKFGASQQLELHQKVAQIRCAHQCPAARSDSHMQADIPVAVGCLQ